MQLLAGLVLGLTTAASNALFVLGIAALLGRRWKRALIDVAAAFVCVAVTMVGFGWLAGALLDGDLWMSGVPVEAKARAFAENISVLTNVAACGVPAGVVVGGLLVWRRHLRTRTS